MNPILIPDDASLEELKIMKLWIHRLEYAVVTAIQKKEKEQNAETPPDLSVHVSESLGVKIERR